MTTLFRTRYLYLLAVTYLRRCVFCVFVVDTTISLCRYLNHLFMCLALQVPHRDARGKHEGHFLCYLGGTSGWLRGSGGPRDVGEGGGAVLPGRFDLRRHRLVLLPGRRLGGAVGRPLHASLTADCSERVDEKKPMRREE